MTDLLDALFFYVEETQLKAYLDADPQYRRAVLQSEQWESDLSDRLERALFRVVLALRRDLDLVLLWGWRR